MPLRHARLLGVLFALAACGEKEEAAVLSDEERLAMPVSLEMGQRLFRQCGTCHNAQAGLPHRVGPNLWGVVGSPAARHADFNYSRALERSGIVWDEEALSAYLENPQQAVPGGRMAYQGMPSLADRRDLIAYLETLQGEPAE